MSMREYPITSSGCIIRIDEDFPAIVKALYEVDDEEAKTYSFCDAFDGTDICVFGEGNGTFYAIKEESELNEIAYNNFDVCVIPFQKSRKWFTAAYNNIYEMVDEIANHKIDGHPLKDLLPDDFDIASHLGTFYSTEWC